MNQSLINKRFEYLVHSLPFNNPFEGIYEEDCRTKFIRISLVPNIHQGREVNLHDLFPTIQCLCFRAQFQLHN